MKGWLRDHRFGADAAQVLLSLWNQTPSRKREAALGLARFLGGEVAAAGAARRARAASSEYSEAIFDAVRALTGGGDADQRHAITLARRFQPAARLETRRARSAPGFAAALRVQTGAVGRGRARGRSAARGDPAGWIERAVEAAAKQPWRLESNRGELMGWIELFAFSDGPGAVIGALDLLPERHRAPWEMERLLSALGESPDEDAATVLDALAQHDARFLKHHAWLSAIVTRLRTRRAAPA